MRKPHVVSKSFPALTSLRFFAALAVVIFHANGHFFAEQSSTAEGGLKNLIPSFFIAVNFFFVLSGFVLAIAYGRNEQFSLSRARFWRARIARIYPVFLVSLVISAAFGLNNISHSETAWQRFRDFILAGGLNLSLLQAWLPNFALGWNAPSWSLSNEAFFYFLFPWLGLAIWKIPHRHLLTTALMIWLLGLTTTWAAARSMHLPLVFGGNLSANAATILDQPASLRLKFAPPFHLFEFVNGIILGRYLLLKNAPTVLKFFPTLIFFTSGILVGFLCFSHIVPYFLMHNGLFTPLFGLIIFGLARCPGIWEKILARQPLLLLGESSYALYILHAPFLGWLIWADKHLQLNRWISLPWLGVLYVLSSVFISVLIFKWVEQPCRLMIQGLRPPAAHSRPN